MNAKNKGINAFDELRSRFGKSQRETGNRYLTVSTFIKEAMNAELQHLPVNVKL